MLAVGIVSCLHLMNPGHSGMLLVMNAPTAIQCATMPFIIFMSGRSIAEHPIPNGPGCCLEQNFLRRPLNCNAALPFLRVCPSWTNKALDQALCDFI